MASLGVAEYRSSDWRRRRDRLHSLEIILGVASPTRTALIDLFNGSLVGNPSTVKLPDGDASLPEVVVVFTTDPGHGLLEASQLVLEVFNGIVKNIELRSLLVNHLPKIVGLENKTWFISQIDIQPRLVPWLLLEPPQRRGPAARGFVEMPRIPPKQRQGSSRR